MIEDKRKLLVKVTDFGLASHMTKGELITDFAGTAVYMAPEILEDLGYDEKVDIWSLGVIVYELLCAELPFKNAVHPEDTDLYDKIKSGKYEITEKYKGISKHAKDFIDCCLILDTAKRPSA